MATLRRITTVAAGIVLAPLLFLALFLIVTVAVLDEISVHDRSA
jgi:hypothetical protein